MGVPGNKKKRVGFKLREKKTIGLIGCGTIGSGWATFLAARGLPVLIFDESPAALAATEVRVKANLSFLERQGVINGDGYQSALKAITICDSLERLVGEADFIQESIYEDYGAKKRLYAALDALVGPDVIIASSSSGLLMTEIQQAARRYPERCLIGHPINPVYLIPLVEIVPGKMTSGAIVAETREFYAALGKVPVVLKKEVPGYLENRLTAALWREAIDLVVNDVATVEDVDKAIWAGPGLRYALMGPHLIYHLGGAEGGIAYFIHHLEEAFRQWWGDMRSWTEFPPGVIEKLQAGVTDSMRGKSIAEVAAWRDAKLVEILRVIGTGEHQDR